MGIFITFEGGEGSGKTTQLKKLAAALQAKHLPVLLTREPGGTQVGGLIRGILLDGTHPPIDPLAELLLYAADRAQHIAEQIRPALQANQIVLCDRFADATVAYQGFGRGLDLGLIADLNQKATEGLRPHLTFLLDCPVEIGLKRSHDRLKKEGSSEDRFEKEALEFHERVRSGYLELAKREAARFRILDATEAPEPLYAKILQETLRRIEAGDSA